MRKIKIKEWLVQGEFSGTEKDSQEVIEAAAGALDSSASHEILGQNLFQGMDGTYYTVTVEAIIRPVGRKAALEMMAAN